MKRVMSIALGAIVGLGLVGANAASDEQTQFGECKTALAEIYGEGARTRLNKVRDRSGATLMTIRVKPAAGDSQTIVCTKGKDGNIDVTDREGVALTPINTDGQSVTSLDD